MNKEDSKWLIFGGGFGIYGYLPAALSCSTNKVYLNKKYRKIIIKRNELNKTIKRIIWYEKLEDIIQNINSVIVATNPETQEEIISKLLNYKFIKKFILEKPLAVSPDKSIILLSKLVEKKINFVCNYSLLHTNWFVEVKENFYQKNNQIIYIDWFFMAHHFKNNIKTWKSNQKEGGGVIRFYGIHLIALLVDLGYHEVNSSKIKVNSEGVSTEWEANFNGRNVPECKIRINSNIDIYKFRISAITKKGQSSEILNLKDPFDQEKIIEEHDRRVFLLGKIILNNHFEQNIKLCSKTNDLWKKSEEILTFK